MSIPEKAPRPACPSEQAIRECITYALEKGYYRESDHAIKDHPERNISIDDVIYGLERTDWTLDRPSEFDAERGEWKHYIKTVDIEGYELLIVLKIMPEYKRFEVITRW
jgi:hypothetical protein